MLTIKPEEREKISVNLPLKGCVAAWPIKKAVASQARSERDSKLVAMGAARVAMIVLSKGQTLAFNVLQPLPKP